MQTTLVPTGGPVGTVAKTVTHAVQKDLMAAFEDIPGGLQDNYNALVDMMMKIEAKWAIKPEISRLLQRSGADQDSLVLLMQRSPDEIKSILNGTLTQDVFGALAGRVREPSAPPASSAQRSVYEPVIYAGYIVDKEGKGIPTSRFDEFLCYMAGAVGLEAISPQLPLNESQLRNCIDQVYAQLSGRSSNFFAEIDANGMQALRDKVETFVNVHRQVTLPSAQQQHLSHVVLPPDVGISARGWQDCAEHKAATLETSPNLFRLTQLVARVMFPGKFADIGQFYLFEVTLASQGEVGKTIASLLCGSHSNMGGFNSEQPGISEDRIEAMSLTQWKEAVSYLDDNHGFLSKWDRNMAAYTHRLNVSLAHEEKIAADAREQRELQAEGDATCRDIDRLLVEVSATLATIDKQKQDVEAKYQQLKAVIAEDRENRHRMEADLAALNELGEALNGLRIG